MMLGPRVDEIDVMIEKIRRRIDTGSRLDPEMAAGLGTGEAMSAIQRKLDAAASACETLDGHVRDLARLHAL